MRSMRNGLAAAALAVVAAVGLASPAQAATYSTGHFDLLDVDYGGSGTPTLNVRQYSPLNDNLTPAGNTFRVLPAAQGALGSGLGCIGAATDQVYRLPQGLNSSLLYAGWNTQGSTSNVTLQLVGASVPSGAKFALYQAVTGGVSIKLNTATGTCNLSSFAVSSNVHGHGNWVFTKAGTYTLTFRAVIGAVNSGNVSYTFSVG